MLQQFASVKRSQSWGTYSGCRTRRCAPCCIVPGPTGKRRVPWRTFTTLVRNFTELRDLRPDAQPTDTHTIYTAVFFLFFSFRFLLPSLLTRQTFLSFEPVPRESSKSIPSKNERSRNNFHVRNSPIHFFEWNRLLLDRVFAREERVTRTGG